MFAGYLMVFLLAIWTSEAVPRPGFRAAITDKGLDYLQVVGIPLLKQELASITIPDISGSQNIGIGEVTYSLTDIQLTDFNIDSSSLTTSPGQGLSLTANGISISASADWSYSAIIVSDSGSMTASADSIDLEISILVGADATGRPNVSCTSCSFDVGHLTVHFDGGASWLYNLFDSYIADDIQDSLNKQVCSLATSSINSAANQALNSIPIIVAVDEVAELNYALTRSPDFNDSYVMSYHKGEFVSVSDPTIEAPFSPPVLPRYTETPKKMVTMWVTDYVANTAILVYKRANYLTYNITPDMVASSGLVKLDTNTFSVFVPQLYKKYPNKNMTLGVRAVEKQPFVTVTPGGANFTLPGAVDFYVIDRNSTPLAFTLGVMAYLDMKASLSVDSKTNCLKISANATYLNADLHVVASNIGDIQVSKMQSLLNSLGKAFIIPQINKFTNFGLPIPIVDGLHFVRSTLSLNKGFAVVETDISYSP